MPDMMNQRQMLLAAALVACVGVAAPANAAGRNHARDGWQLGLSYGYSSGRVTLADAQEGTARGGATPQLRLGHAVGRHFALGVEYNGWMLEDGDADLKLRASLQQIMAAATWYPGKPESAAGGFYVRAGVGLGWASIAAIEIVDQIQEDGERIDETGLGLLAGIGYEFRISPDVAAGLGFGFNQLLIDKDIYDSGWFTPITGTLAWYWD